MWTFFNLEHTWAEWADVGLSTNCNQDDFVADTPNCIGSTVLAILLHKVVEL